MNSHIGTRRLAAIEQGGTQREVLTGPARDGEEFLFVDSDVDEITRGKFDFEVAGHYARPDAFRLIVDEASKPPVLPAQ